MKRIEYISEEVSKMIPLIKRRMMSNVFQKIQISPAQMLVIMHLGQMETCNFKHLCEGLDVSAPTMTGIVDRLEKAKYALRHPDSEDRRVINVVLTAKGKKLAFELKEEMKNQMMGILEKLSKADQENYYQIVKKIHGVIQ